MRRALAISTIAHSILFALIFVTGYTSQPITTEMITVSLIEAPKPTSETIQAEQQKVNQPPQPKQESEMKYEKEEKTKKQEKSRKPIQQKSQTPKPTASSGTKSSSATGIRVDSQGFNFGYYLEIIKERVSDNWSPPPVGTEMAVSTVYFKIRRNGEITDIKLEKTSGFDLFDRAAMKAVSDAAPLPPLPAGFKGQWLGVHFEFEYKSG